MPLILRTSADFGALIRDRRKALGLGQQELATRIGANRRWVIDVEKGKPRAEVGMILRALDALGVELTILDEGASPNDDVVDAPDIDAVIQRARKRRR